jgi:hypothetical protein
LGEVKRQHRGRIFVIPAKLENCNPPDHLAHLQWVDLHKRGFSNLCRAPSFEGKATKVTLSLFRSGISIASGKRRAYAWYRRYPQKLVALYN